MNKPIMALIIFVVIITYLLTQSSQIPNKLIFTIVMVSFVNLVIKVKNEK